MLVECRVRRLVSQIELLRQRQPDGARQRQLVLLKGVLGHNQLLLQRLIIHARPQFVEQRRSSGVVIATAWSSETFAVATCASSLLY